MKEILETINKQSLGLASSVAFYNLHLLFQTHMENFSKLILVDQNLLEILKL
jgi:hypothetical protein